MKKIIKGIIQLNLILLIALIISIGLSKVNILAFAEREFNNGRPPLDNESKDFDDLVGEGAYLGTEQGQTFFDSSRQVLEGGVFWGNMMTSLFLPSVNFDEWDIVNGYRQYGPIICHYFNNTSYPDLYDYNTIKSWDSVLKNVRYKMCIYTFLWNQWGEYAEEGVPDNRGEGVDTLYLSGKIKYIHKYTKTEMNNAMAYILADCDDNTVEPPDSYVNTAFWNFLSGSGSNSGSSGQNSVDTSNISSNLTRYENKLKNNQDLSKSEIKNLIKWLNYLSDNKRTSAYKIMSDYENFDDKNYDKTEKQKKKLKQQLYNKIINNVISEIRNALSNQSSVSVKSLGLIQAAQDFENMHREIGGDYKSKIYDRTNPKNITVEYNAQTKKYLVGPFKIQYIERYINGEQFAGMTGKPILELKKNNVQVNYELGNRWNFVYKNARMAGFPNNTYPHSNEEFYISLDYIEGINQIIGIKFDFRYLTASAQWSYSDGKAEMLKLRLILMGNYLYSPDGQDCKGPLCDAGKADYGSEVGERQYHHYTEDPLFTTNIHYHDSPCKPCSGHDTNGDGVIDTYHYNELDENGNWKTGPYDANKTYAKCSPCQGHKCTIPEPCEHGFYGGHVIDLGFKYVVIPSGEIDISDVATVQSARRGYAGLSWTLGNPPGGNPPDGGGNPSWTIDLTTTMAGNVWEEIDSQKDSNGIIGTKDDEEANKGLENIAVTVKLYDEDGNFVKNGICHKTNGEAVKWPIYTDNNGYYEINRLEAPGVDGTENKLFYVVEFEYDGQTYKHTVYMANPNSNVNNVAEEGKASNYTAKVINNITGEIEADKYKNSSMAVEEVNDRYKFDRTFGEITGNSSVYEENGEYKTAGITKTTDYYGKNGRDNTNDKYNQLSYKGKKEGNLVNSVFESPYTDSSNQLGNSPAKVSDLDKDVTKDEYERYRMVASTYYDDTSRHGLTLDINDYRLKFPLEGWTYILNNKSIEESRDAQGNITRISKRYIADYMLHINLGLQKRKEADISVLEDLYKITLTVNGQKVTKEMDKLDTEANYTQAFDNLNSDMMYSLGLYKADVQYTHKNRYQNAIDIVKELKEGTELRVFVTYKTKVFNNSDTNDVEINELTNYYDPTFTLLNTNVAVPIINENMKLNKNTVVADEPYCRIIRQEMAARGFKPTKAEDLAGYENKQNTELTWDLVGTENGYKVAKLNKLSETKLKAGETVEIFTTYEIDKEGYEAIKDTEENDLNIIEGLREKLLGNKFNTVEISNYSTYYSEEDVDKEPYYTAYSKDKQLLWVSGRIDKDSAPNNIDRAGVMNKEKYEDDTSQSYVLDIKFKTNDREAFGYVWEDEKKEDVTIKDDVNVKVGDGQYQETEKLIPNVKVSMYEVINLTDIGDRTLAYDGLEYYYKIPNQFYTPDGSTNDVYTKGEKIDNKEGNYYLSGFTAGDYVIRFDYGTKADEENAHENWDINEEGHLMTTQNQTIKYNGQDYENTRFLGENTTEHLNDKYLELGVDMDGQAISKARDNESRRMVVDAYSRNIENERGEILRNRRADNTEYVEATQMFAETPVMQVEVEDPKRIVESEVPGSRGDNPPEGSTAANIEKTEIPGENEEGLTKNADQGYTIQNINLGLEKRAETDIKLEQYVNNIYILKDDETLFSAEMTEDGQVIMASENAKNLDKLTYMAHAEQQQGFFALNIEDDYLNGLSLLVRYKIKVINNSEIDYTGFLVGQYLEESIKKLASRPPTTALYDEIIRDLIKESDGISSNATLQELLDSEYDETNQIDNLLNLSAAVNKETDTIRPEIIIYGKYVGRFYYENRVHEDQSSYSIKNYSSDKNTVEQQISYVGDNVVETTVDQLIDYIDVNTSLDEESSIGKQDCSWVLTSTNKGDIDVDLDRDGTKEDEKIKTITDLNGLISNASYRLRSNEANEKTDLYDEKGRQLVTGTGTNVVMTLHEYMEKVEKEENGIKKYRMKYIKNNSVSDDNASLTKGMAPLAYTNNPEESSRVEFVITRKNVTSGMDADEMNIDNLVEVLVYSNPTGRRDVNSVPGNAMVIGTEKGMWKAGYNSVKVHQNEVGENWELVKTNWRLYPENDANATEFITVIPPTGIAIHDYVRTRIVPIVILTTSAMLLMGIFIIKQQRMSK